MSPVLLISRKALKSFMVISAPHDSVTFIDGFFPAQDRSSLEDLGFTTKANYLHR